MRIGLATCSVIPEGHPQEQPLLDLLKDRGAEAGFVVWTDQAVAWESFDLVVVRSVWDYTERREQFVAWAEAVGARLQNPPALLAWNSDKRYLGELSAAGLAVVPTDFVDPGAPLPTLEGEVAVKPSVSAGARDTGRFSSRTHAEATGLIERILGSGRTAMVQPYLSRVDTEGECSIVFFGGEESHVLRKGQVLAPDEVAGIGNEAHGSARVMSDENLVRAGTAAPPHRALAAEVLAYVEDRFGAPPCYCRVDMLPGDDGAPVLGELEAIEPHLYLREDPGASSRFADAIVASVTHSATWTTNAPPRLA